MILGMGTDMVDCRRIDRSIRIYGSRFLNRVFTPSERTRFPLKNGAAQSYGKLFAAKEALLKAIGTGMTGGINWQQIEVRRQGNTPPTFQLSGAALRHFNALIPSGYVGNFHLSLTDEWPYAMAFVILSSTCTTD